MAITRSSTHKKLSRRRAIKTGSCSCIWCQTWKPRKVYKYKKITTKLSPIAIAVAKAPAAKKAAANKTTAFESSASFVDPMSLSLVDPAARDIVANLTTANTKIHLMVTPTYVPYNASLALVNLADNMDEFFILQAIEAGNRFFVFSKWGHTGTSGQTKLSGPTTFGDARASFCEIFLEKTGNEWDNKKKFTKIDGKYDLLKETNSKQASGSWEYYMDDFVDGKTTGWYPYTAEGTTQTELLYQTHQTNSAYNRRIVQSGYFKYCIDLDEMTQTNIKTNKRRQIRRL
ncbi:hypothetical protein LEN26_010020 [Aphanomyces euteiches]|nr:hypothetical protein LEN26_010020 [Aphanomyces euteiches]KAH9124888.1 hypothetical protein AeMF1_004414 [Aphanomyces euteiches]KAH9182417.1 hypothetical protein AeNC1_015608 [Aphanomyces euteiches]